MHLRQIVSIAALLLATAVALLAPRGLVHATPPPPSSQLSDCVVTVTQRVDTPLLLAGEEAEVTMRIEPFCPLRRDYMHVVFALPATDALPDRERSEIRDDVQALIDKILENAGEECCGGVLHAKIGIATYNSRGQMPCQLMEDPDRLKRCADRIMQDRPGNDPNFGLRSAQNILLRARDPGSMANEIVILVAGGPDEIDRCPELTRTAGGLKSQGVLIISVCASDPHCDAACVRSVASSARYFYHRIHLISPVFERIRCECINISLRQLQWSTTLAPDLIYVEDSSSLPVEPREADAALAWSQNFIPKQGLTLSYRVRPDWLGFRQIELGSEVSFRDNQNRAGAAGSTSTLDLAVFRPFREEP